MIKGRILTLRDARTDTWMGKNMILWLIHLFSVLFCVEFLQLLSHSFFNLLPRESLIKSGELWDARNIPPEIKFSNCLSANHIFFILSGFIVFFPKYIPIFYWILELFFFIFLFFFLHFVSPFFSLFFILLFLSLFSF